MLARSFCTRCSISRGLAATATHTVQKSCLLAQDIASSRWSFAASPQHPLLVGAFGRSHIGFHSELLCQINGSHDNATYYRTSNLRSTRFCNLCREMVAYRVLSRIGLVATFNEWTSIYRPLLYQRYSMTIPAMVPQRTSAGTSVFEACSQAYLSSSPGDNKSSSEVTATPAGPIRIGDVVLAPEDLIGLGGVR